MMKKIVFSLCLLFSSFSLYAQNSQEDQFQKQIEEIMKAREEMFRSILDDSTMRDFESRMQEMMKRFNGPDFDLSDFESPVIGQYDWEVTETQKILKLKVKQAPGHPLDIKIEQGMIKIKGDVVATQGSGKNKVTRKSSFQRSFSLPDDIDQNNPEFENKDGEVWIKFKRLAPGAVSKKELKKKAPKNDAKTEERTPVGSEGDDLKI